MLQDAIRVVGGQAALAAICGVTPQAITTWIRRGVPAERVIGVARACNFAITPHELRPDLYPHPSDGLPEAMKERAA